MKLLSYRIRGVDSFGLVVGEGVVDLRAAVPDAPATLKAALATGRLSTLIETARDRAPAHRLSEVELLPVISDPDKILCVGLNYHAHRLETGRDETAYPVLFTRFANTLVGHGQPMVRPRVSDKFDFEGELAVIIGRPGRHITEAHALDHVAGYACFCDGTIRNWQKHTHQFTPGKNFVQTAGFGPYLVTPDEVGDPSTLELESRLNGERMQHTTTDLMIFSIPYLISYISTFTQLEAGDVIATGTPSGVGFKREPPVYLKAGDRFEVEISRVGLLSNPIIDE